MGLKHTSNYKKKKKRKLMEIYHRSPFKYIKITCITDIYQKTLEQVLVRKKKGNREWE